MAQTKEDAELALEKAVADAVQAEQDKCRARVEEALLQARTRMEEEKQVKLLSICSIIPVFLMDIFLLERKSEQNQNKGEYVDFLWNELRFYDLSPENSQKMTFFS